MCEGGCVCCLCVCLCEGVKGGWRQGRRREGVGENREEQEGENENERGREGRNIKRIPINGRKIQ